jgi:large subunit ribosomal protein L18
MSGPMYNLPFRRRREKRTDYKARKALISSGLPRLVVRGTNKHMTVQLVEAHPTGDKVIASANSVELAKRFSWKIHCGNVPSAYLTGLLAGVKAKNKGLSKAVLDMGLRKASKGCRIFAALKGAVDSGIEIPHDDEVFPEDSRLCGEHIAEYGKILAKDQETYSKHFSKYISTGVKMEDFSKYFEETKNKILQATPEAVKAN